MVETKGELSDKVVLGILAGAFSFLITALANGVAVWTAVVISVVIAVLGFVFAVVGVQQISVTRLGTMFLELLRILLDKTKTPQEKTLLVEMTIKKEMELLNLSWTILNEATPEVKKEK